MALLGTEECTYTGSVRGLGAKYNNLGRVNGEFDLLPQLWSSCPGKITGDRETSHQHGESLELRSNNKNDESRYILSKTSLSSR